MALDGVFLYTVKRELEPLIGARIDKIHQPSKEEIIISFRANGGNYKLLFSASASNARVHITNVSVENPKAPPMFCMLMRKHLGNGKLLNIRQDGLERILYFDFEAMNEMGDMVKITLASEIMGRYSNLILINSEGKILDSIKRVDEEMSRERLVLPGMKYEVPPRDGRLNLFNASDEEIKERLSAAKNDELSKVLIRVFEGISPIFARECEHYAAKGQDLTLEEMTADRMDRLMFYLSSEREKLQNRQNHFQVVLDKDNHLKDFCFTEIRQYGTLMYTREMPSACETLDYFYSERDSVNRMKQRSHDLLKFLANTSDRISRKLSVQRDELKQCAKRDELKLKGDLLSANIYRLEKGMTSVELENYYEENLPMLKIDLNPRLTPSQNSQSYYSEYRKAVTAEKMLTELIQKGEEDLAYIDSVFDALTRTVSENEVLELKYELAEQGFLRAYRLKGKPPKTLPPLEFVSSDGFPILVGRNNKQNDKLTLKTAEKTDIWCHTHNIPGSHVIIFTDGKTPPDRTLEEACVLAAYHSKARDSAQVPVDYAQVKFVKKPAGAKPGMVIFTNNQTAYVTPDSERVQGLKK